MSISSHLLSPKLKFHPDAYRFVFEGLKYAQQQRELSSEAQEDEAGLHISGQELLEGIRALALELYGPMAPTVFRHWGVRSTYDFGRIVFDLIDRGEMSKTDRDQLSDFSDVYEFEDVFLNRYHIDVSQAFSKSLRTD